MSAVALPPAKFYGRDLPRPRYFDDGSLNSVRVEPPVGVNSALLAWAADASWEMGGLNMNKRRRAPKVIEGRVDKLRTMAKKARRVEAKEAKASRRGRVAKKSALGKRAAAALEEDDDMFADSEDEGEARAEEQTLRRRLMVEDEEEEGEQEEEEEEEEEEDVRDMVDEAADSEEEEEEEDVVTPLPPLTRGSRIAKTGSKGPPRAGSIKTEPVLAPIKGRKPAHLRALHGTAAPTKMERRNSVSSTSRPAKGPAADPFAFASNSPEEAAKGSRRRTTRRTPDLITPTGRGAGASQAQNGRRTRRQATQGAEQQRGSDSSSSAFSDSPLQAADSSSESETLRPRLLEPELEAAAAERRSGAQLMTSDGESAHRRSARGSAAATGGRTTRSSPKDSPALGSRVRRRLA